MSNQLQNICVFIEDEKQLQEARELLERFGQVIWEMFFWVSETNPNDNFLYYVVDFGWSLLDKENGLNQITLTELEKLLEDEK